MKRIKEYLFALSIIASPSFPLSISGQPTTLPSQASTQTKFRKTSNAIPNKYIVVLNENVVSRTATRALDRSEQESSILNNQYVFNATGAGVSAYVIDTGIRSTHVDLGGRASIAADFVGFESCNTPGNNDCHFHGTHVAGTVGGARFGAAKGVTIRAVKVCNQFGQCNTSTTVTGINS